MACNGVPGTVVGGVGFVCLNVPVAPGTNTIAVQARDRMGLLGTASQTVYVGNGPAPTKITVSPARTTLVVSDTRELRVRDDRGGRAPADADPRRGDRG